MAELSDVIPLHGGSPHIELVKRAADALMQGDDYYREVLEALPAAIYMTDRAGRITFFNEAAARLWGCRPVLGRSEWCGTWKLYWPDGRVLPHDQCPMAMALRESRPIRGIEAVAERPDGSRVPFLPFPTPLHDGSGNLRGAVNMLLDLTDRDRADTDQQRLAAIIESSDDAIISKDLNSIITTWNAAAERIFGYTAAEAIGKSVTMLIPPERRDEEPHILTRILRGERIDHYETVRRRKDGGLIDISLTVSPIRNREGRIVGASKIARDISERKRAQEQRNLLIEEIKHRMKNTIATVHAIASQTLRSVSRAELDAFLGRLQALARAHDQLTIEHWNRTPLDGVVREALAPFQESNVARILIEGPARISLDANRASLLTMVLHELATNAVKYGALSNGAGRVAVTWEQLADRESPHLRLSWKESGGPPVAAPQRRGFGSHLIERALAGDPGETRLEFNPAGLQCSLEIPL
jgi:PAS domain S-box-containing protein